MKAILLTLAFTLISTLSFSQPGWISQNSNINKPLTDVFFINEQRGWIVTDSSKVLKTNDGGLTWTSQTLPYYSPLNSIYFINENTGWTGGGYFYFFHSGVIFKTTNGGMNWFTLSYPSEVRDIYFINSNTGFAGIDNSGDFESGGGILKTTNGGINWDGQLSNYTISSLNFKNSDTGFAIGYYQDDTGHDSSIVYRTINGGSSWEVKYKENNFQIYYSHLRQISVVENNVWVCGMDSSILYSSNSGENWVRLFVPIPRIMESVCFINQQTGWAVGRGYTDTTNIIKTTNSGMNWFNLKSNYNNWLYSVMFVNEYTGWTVGDYGTILKTTTGGLTFINNPSTNISSSYILNQNYPNPFNPSTVIRYSLPERGDVRISVYSIQGKELKTLVAEIQPAGNYETTFNAKELSSGIYFYSLFANRNFIDTRKMIVLK